MGMSTRTTQVTQYDTPEERIEYALSQTPIPWRSLLYNDICKVILAADRIGDVELLKKARAALRQREADTRPAGTPGWASPYRA